MASLFPTRRKERDPIVRVLRGVPIFQDLTRRELTRLRAILHTRTYEKGEAMFEFGQPGAAMFVIQEGEVSITLPDDDDEGSEFDLATLKDGQFLGELALLDDSPRSASARARRRTTALAFFRSDLNKLLETEPEIGSKIYKELALFIGKRLKAMNEQLSDRDDNEKHAIEHHKHAPLDEDEEEEFSGPSVAGAGGQGPSVASR